MHIIQRIYACTANSSQKFKFWPKRAKSLWMAQRHGIGFRLLEIAETAANIRVSSIHIIRAHQWHTTN